MNIKRILTIIIAAAPLLLMSGRASAQQFSVSTDVLKWAWLGTANASFSYAPARHWTIGVQADYNPWTYHKGEPKRQFQEREVGVAAQGRYWPWNAYSGWFIGGELRWEQYNRGGLIDRRTREGNAYGLGLSFGYSLMLHHNLNIEFGLGVWGGYTTQTIYACPKCGRIIEEGGRAFFAPNEAAIALVYTF